MGPPAGVLNLGVAVLAPTDPDGTIIQMLDPYTSGVADVSDDLVPSFRAFVVAPGNLHQLNPLYPRGCDQALQAVAYKLVGLSRFRFGVGGLDHASLFSKTVCIHSICTDISWQ